MLVEWFRFNHYTYILLTYLFYYFLSSCCLLFWPCFLCGHLHKPLFCYDIFLLWHCFTMTLFCYDIVLLWHCFTMTLFCYDIVLLWHCFAMTLFCYDIVLLWHCLIVLLQCVFTSTCITWVIYSVLLKKTTLGTHPWNNQKVVLIAKRSLYKNGTQI